MRDLYLSPRVEPEYRYLNQCHERLRHYTERCTVSPNCQTIADTVSWSRNLCGEYLSLVAMLGKEPKKGAQAAVEEDLSATLQVFRKIALQTALRGDTQWMLSNVRKLQGLRREMRGLRSGKVKRGSNL